MILRNQDSMLNIALLITKFTYYLGDVFSYFTSIGTPRF